MKSEAMERMVKGRVGLLVREPFFGTLATRLELVEDPTVKTMATNGRELRFNPEWVMGLPMSQIEGVEAHEVGHCAFGHHLRREGRKFKQWNEACDHAINHELVAAGFDLPEGALLDSQYKSLPAEAIYAAMIREEDQQQASGGGSGSSPNGSGEESTGVVEDAVDENGNQADAADREEQEAEWQTAIAQAAQAARGMGKLGGDIERAVKEMLSPKVSWREALQRLLRAKSKDDYSWARPNRRMLWQGCYLPSLDAPRCGILAFAIDVSGSIGQSTMDQFASEVDDARRTLNPERVVVMMFDTSVKEIFDVKEDEPLVLYARAGGGTSFTDPVRRLAELEVDPEVLVYLTDLCSSSFPEEPAYPVVWVTTRPRKAPFGDVIPMY